MKAPRHARDGWQIALVLVLSGVFLLSCGSSGDSEGLTSLTLISDSGTKAGLRVEIAATREELAQGLTGRQGLATDAGMLFVIEERGPGFWMKGVGFPLSVAFISECGEVVALTDMQPLSLDFHDTEKAYRFGLEVNRGWFASHGIDVGATVVLPRHLHSSACH